MRELKRFLYVFRNFELTTNFFKIQNFFCRMCSKDITRKTDIFKKNLNSSKEDWQFEAFKVLKINKIVKKPNHRSRPRADRTRSYEKMKKKINKVVLHGCGGLPYQNRK